MKARSTEIGFSYNNIVRLIIGAGLILLVPLVAMQFNNDVKWGLEDFIAMGALLIGAGLVFELVAKKVKSKYRPAIGLIIVIAVLLVWVELAVGIFGTPFAGN